MQNINRLFWSLLLIIGGIVLAHLMLDGVRVLGYAESIFYMDERITLAAFFSTVVAFANGLLIHIFVIPKMSQKGDKILWTFASSFFFLLALDEYFELHEYANTIITISSQGSLFHQLAKFSWIFPLAIIILGVFYAFMVLIFREKERSVKRLLVIGITSYAVILALELVGGSLYGQYIYKFFVAAEEGLEMTSSVIFLRAILTKEFLLRQA